MLLTRSEDETKMEQVSTNWLNYSLTRFRRLRILGYSIIIATKSNESGALSRILICNFRVVSKSQINKRRAENKSVANPVSPTKPQSLGLAPAVAFSSTKPLRDFLGMFWIGIFLLFIVPLALDVTANCTGEIHCLALDGVYLSTVLKLNSKEKNSRQSQDSNPGQLGGKQECYLCATQPPCLVCKFMWPGLVILIMMSWFHLPSEIFRS